MRTKYVGNGALFEVVLPILHLITFPFSLLPIARRAHRGVRNGGITKNKPVPKKGAAAAPSTSKSKKLKLSTVRRNEIMGLPLDAPLGVQLFDTERSKDMRTLEQKNRLLSWVSFCMMF